MSLEHVVILVASSGNDGSSNGGNDGSSGNDGSGGIMTVAMTIFDPTQILLGKGLALLRP